MTKNKKIDPDTILDKDDIKAIKQAKSYIKAKRFREF